MDKKYISEFQFIGSSVKSLTIKNNFIALERTGANHKLEIFHSVEPISTINDEKTFSSTILLNIKVGIDLNSKKYEVDLTIEGCFNAPVEMGEETFVEMLNVNGVTTLYSIARGFIQSTTSQTLVAGSILLPMFNVAAYSKDLNAKQTTEQKTE